VVVRRRWLRPGTSIGQFIAGLSRMHATTGDAGRAAKARRLVRGYGAFTRRTANR
jgi:hypothetical protein